MAGHQCHYHEDGTVKQYIEALCSLGFERYMRSGSSFHLMSPRGAIFSYHEGASSHRVSVEDPESSCELTSCWSSCPTVTTIAQEALRLEELVFPVPAIFRRKGDLRIVAFVTLPHPNHPDSIEGLDENMASHAIDDWGAFIGKTSPMSKQPTRYSVFYEDIIRETGLRLNPMLRYSEKLKMRFLRNQKQDVEIQTIEQLKLPC